MIAYETLLDRDRRWALREGSMHFEKESRVHQTLRRVARKLEEIGVPYAVAGGMALFFHGYRRFTEDVDILVKREDIKVIHDELSGRGYIEPFAASKNLRDSDSGVRIEFLASGDYPGDGKPKPVAFPDPTTVRHVIDGVAVVRLSTLVEMKIASGMTNPGRMKDLGDVQEVIRHLGLQESFAEQLDPYVREKYLELWRAVKNSPD